MSIAFEPHPQPIPSSPPPGERFGSDADAGPRIDASADWLDNPSTTAAVGSMLAHLILVLGLALIYPTPATNLDEVVIVSSKPPAEPVDELEVLEDITYSDAPQAEIGAIADAEDSVAEAAAELFAEVAEIPKPLPLDPNPLGQIPINAFEVAAAPMQRLSDRRGNVGVGVAGAAGAVDRITFEILKSMEERPTLVVWLFDQSGSLQRQRLRIRDRFRKVYDELDVARERNAKAFRNTTAAEEPEVPDSSPGEPRLLTSLVGFGRNVTLYTKKPITDREQIQAIVDSIEVDFSGEERAFSAVIAAVNRYRALARGGGSDGPERNLILVMVTDERGDDAARLEDAIDLCRRFAIPVYVIGVPAPFGREHTLVKYVDPDPRFDQSTQWAQVDQGPETLYPERVQISFTGNYENEPVLDSGFGPYALTRLAYETGGIYFSVHPNRKTGRRVSARETDEFASRIEYFFDAEVMERYRPDYLSRADYLDAVGSSPLRTALHRAAQMRPAVGIDRPRLRFPRFEDAQLVRDLTIAQRDAAMLEPTLQAMVATLRPGMDDRQDESSPRWRAGYDLAMGRVLAQKVRTETYNAMLAKAKRGMAFSSSNKNTWVLRPANEITVGSRWKNEADLARQLLNGVIQDHPGTPWELMAKRELAVPIGWRWTESFTKPPEPPQPNPGNNNNNMRTPRDDQRRMLERRPTRPIPKL